MIDVVVKQRVTTTQHRIGLAAGVALFTVPFLLILLDHRDGKVRMVALVSFGFLCLEIA